MQYIILRIRIIICIPRHQRDCIILLVQIKLNQNNKNNKHFMVSLFPVLCWSKEYFWDLDCLSNTKKLLEIMYIFHFFLMIYRPSKLMYLLLTY